MGKHVIILGAGASYTSGYPLAADLRAILSSIDSFKGYVEGKTSQHHQLFREKLFQRFSYNEPAIRLFREGGFATVDEFSFLSRNKLREEVANMRRLMTLVLALHNPESNFKKNGSNITTTGFESSDYYPFLQKLFDESLHELRSDISVLSYNYDGYLEFLLHRALSRRKNAARQVVSPGSLARVTSGFDGRNAAALTSTDFCLLKLHGTTVVPSLPRIQGEPNDYLTYEEVFGRQESFHRQFDQPNSLDSPVYFPWELIDEDGQFISEEQFSEFEEMASGNMFYRQERKQIYPVCRAIWQRAQKEISEADKISFVGLSFHNFLVRGMKFLFSSRNASKPISNLVFVGPQFHPSTISKGTLMFNRARHILGQISPGFFGDIGVTNTYSYENFNSFIREEMT